MATQVKHRRGTNAEVSGFTPAVGEIVMDTDNKQLVLGDGVKQGGHVVAQGNVKSTVVEIENIKGEKEGQVVHLAAEGRSGVFEWSPKNLSNEVALDTLQGVYIAPSTDPTGGSGAWVRKLEGFVTPDMFGAAPTLADNSPQINKAFALSVELSVWCVILGSTYSYQQPLILLDGLRLTGRASARLEKDFTQLGSDAGLMPQNLGFNINGGDGVENVVITNLELGASAYEIEGVRTNKIINLVGKDIYTDNIKIKTWSGWAFVFGGDRIKVCNTTFEDPAPIGTGGGDNGIDGLHQTFGNDCLISGVYGVSTDDLVAIAPPLLGAVADGNIKRTTVRDVKGVSTDARILLVSLFDASHTGELSDIFCYNICGKGGTSSTGAISVFNTSESGGNLENVHVEGYEVDSTNSKFGLLIRGSSPSNPANASFPSNISIKKGRVYGTGEVGVQIAACGEKIETEGFLDCSQMAGVPVQVNPFQKQDFLKMSHTVVCPPSVTNALVLANGTSELASSNLDFVIKDVPSSGRAIALNKIVDSRIKIVASKKVGATNTEGVSEPAASGGNSWRFSDFRDLDSPVINAKRDSEWSNVRGFKTASFGVGEVPQGSISVAIPHGVDYTPLPSDIKIVPRNNSVKNKTWDVTSVGATTFTVRVDSDPLAGGWDFDWAVERVTEYPA